MMVRKILQGLGILLALGAVALAFILVPPHLQIRDISPELPTKSELANLKGHADGPVKIGYMITSTQKSDVGEIGHTTFAVEWENGNMLLIDLGMDKQVAIEFGELFETVAGAEPAVSHGTVAEFLGDDLRRVKGVAFTHLHSDHVQGIEPLCASGAKDISALHTNDQMTKHNLHTEDQIDMLKNSECIDQKEITDMGELTKQFPGIGIYPLGGHTPGSTLFAIPVGDELWLLSGDISNAKNDLIENQSKGLIYSYLLVPEDEARLEEIRLWLSDLDQGKNFKVIVSHDVNALIESGMNEWQQSEQAE